MTNTTKPRMTAATPASRYEQAEGHKNTNTADANTWLANTNANTRNTHMWAVNQSKLAFKPNSARLIGISDFQPRHELVVTVAWQRATHPHEAE